MSTDTTIPDANGVARDQLRAFIERVERVEEEIATLNTDKSDIYKEARAVGFDVKVLRKVVAKRKLETHVREEQDAIFDMYWEALYGAPVQVHTRTRENIEEFRRSDNGLNIQTKHGDIRTAPETAEESLANGPCEAESERTAGEVDGATTSLPTNSPETATECAAPEKDAAADERDVEADGGASLVRTLSDQPGKGGNHEVASIAERERETVTSNTGEGAANTALPETGQFIEDVPPTPMKRLHYAHCFPELTKAEYGRLEFSIIGIGVSKPIIRMGDVIVDGWARYTICRTLGIAYPIKNYSGNDVLLDVIELQRAARSFTPAQEQKIAADLAKEIPHRADEIMAAFGLAEALEAAE